MKSIADKPEVKIVVVGHVDHGKSTTIGRLLFDTHSLSTSLIQELQAEATNGNGIDFAHVIDHLKEERENAMTIDTSQVQCETEKKCFVLIDAPGHREFLKNMITGATQADAALLLVDVNEGLREQTQRHAYMLSLVGVQKVLVAINKMDAVGYDRKRYEAVRKELLKFFKQIGVKPAQVIPVSSRLGENISAKSKNMKWFRGPALLQAFDRIEPAEADLSEPLRFPVQDVYRVDGKDVLVGRVEAGKLKKGEKVVLMPSKRKAVIKSVEVFLQRRTDAIKGEAVGITLDGPAKRGEIVAPPAKPPSSASTIKARIFSFSTQELRLGHPITLKLATQDLPARLAKIHRRIDSSSLVPVKGASEAIQETEVADVELQLGSPLVFDRYNRIPEMGRFVLTLGSDPVAGGIVTG